MHQRIAIREQIKGQLGGIDLGEPGGGPRGADGLDEGLEQGAIQAEIDLGDPPHGGEAAFVLGVGVDDGPDVVQGAPFETNDPVTADQFRIGRLRGLGCHHRLVEAGRQHIDQVDVGGEFIVLLLGDAAGDEDTEVANVLMDRIDNGLATGEQILVRTIEIDDPTEGLRRRGDVVSLGAEAQDRRADVAQIDPRPVAGDDLRGGEVIADEQLIDNPLHLRGIKLDVATPPLFEFQEALLLGVDLGPEGIVLGPEGIGGIEVLEVRNQIGAIEGATAQITHQRRHPTAARQPAGVAHGILALHTGPVRQGRARDDEGSEQFRPHGGYHHHRPPSLTIADDAGFALGRRM